MEKERREELNSDSQNFISSLDSLLDVDSLPNLENLSRESPPALLRNTSQIGAEMEMDVDSPVSELIIDDISTVSDIVLDGFTVVSETVSDDSDSVKDNNDGLPEIEINSISAVSETVIYGTDFVTVNNDISVVSETVVDGNDLVTDDDRLSDGISAVSETVNDGISVVSETVVYDTDLVTDDDGLSEIVIDGNDLVTDDDGLSDSISAVSEAVIYGNDLVTVNNDDISVVSETVIDDNALVKDDDELPEIVIDGISEVSETIIDGNLPVSETMIIDDISLVSETVIDGNDWEKDGNGLPVSEMVTDNIPVASEMVINVLSPESELVIDCDDLSEDDNSLLVSEKVNDSISAVLETDNRNDFEKEDNGLLVSETVTDDNDSVKDKDALPEIVIDNISAVAETDNDGNNLEEDENGSLVPETVTDRDVLEKDDNGYGFEFFEEEIFHSSKASTRHVMLGDDMYTISEIGSEEESEPEGEGSELLKQSESEEKSAINKEEVKSICEKSAMNKEEGKSIGGKLAMNKDGKGSDPLVEKQNITKRVLDREQTRDNKTASCIEMMKQKQKDASIQKEQESKGRTLNEKQKGKCGHKMMESVMKDNKPETDGGKQKQKLDIKNMNTVKVQLARTMNVAKTQLARMVKTQLANKEREITELPANTGPSKTLTANAGPSKTLFQLRKEAREARSLRMKEAENAKKRSSHLIENNKQNVEKTVPHLAKIDEQKLKEIKEKRARNKTKETGDEQTSENRGKLNVEQGEAKSIDGKNSLYSEKKKERTEAVGPLSSESKLDQKKRKADFELNENAVVKPSKIAKISKVENAKSEVNARLCPTQPKMNTQKSQSDLQGQAGERNKTKSSKPAIILNPVGLGRCLIEARDANSNRGNSGGSRTSVKNTEIISLEKKENKLIPECGNKQSSTCKTVVTENNVEKSKTANANIPKENVTALKKPTEGTSSAGGGGGSSSLNVKTTGTVAGDDVYMLSDEEFDDSEVSAWLDAGLQKAKDGEKPEDILTMEKIILAEKGENACEMLPQGWVKITHHSGMPVYLHKQSRVCCMARPYFVGSCTIRKHHVPLSAIPCLHYKRELEKEKKAAEEGKKGQGDTKGQVGGQTGDQAGQGDGTKGQTSQGDDTKGQTSNQTGQGGDAKAAMVNGDVSAEKEKTDDGKCRREELSQAVVQAESVATIDHETLREYCKGQFIFRTVTTQKFRTWKEKRSHFVEERRKRQEQVPTLSKDMKLITRAFHGKDKPNQKKEHVLNPVGKTPACILHEFTQQVLKVQPTYDYKEIENSETPYKATVIIEGIQYGSGVASGKKQAKAEAAKATLEIFLPSIAGQWKDDAKAKTKYSQSTEADMVFFEEIVIEDPRVSDLCEKAALPRPYEVLQECLRRNFGMGDTSIHVNQKMLSNQKSEFSITVGKHTATVACKNKREGRQRAAQAILQKLHPKLKNWASLLRLYSNCNTHSYKEMEEDEDEDGNSISSTEKNFEILKKLKESMRKVKRRKEALAAGDINDSTLAAQPLDL